MARKTRSDKLHGLGVIVGGFLFTTSSGALAQGLESPWPMQGQNSARSGRTVSVGPQTSTIAWSIRVDPNKATVIIDSSPTIANDGLLYVGRLAGVACVDTLMREIAWEVNVQRGGATTVEGSPAISGDLVVWSDVGGNTDNSLFCSDRRTGATVWEETDVSSFSPVTTDDRVFFLNQQGSVACRDLATGEEIWTTPTTQPTSTLSFDPNVGVITPFGTGSTIASLDPHDGSIQWSVSSHGTLQGTLVIEGNRVYFGTSRLYALDAVTGEELMDRGFSGIIRGAVCVGHDGTVYTGPTSGPKGSLNAVSPSGQLLWTLSLPGFIKNAPIVAGDGTVYVTSNNSSPEEGYVHAVRPDGTELWTVRMPRHVFASPMLAPDGTLYVLCRDQNIYAFHDPPNPSVTLTGTCPGSATLDVVGASANAAVAIVFASDRDDTTIPSGFVCEGTTLHLNATARVVETGTTDANGDYATGGQLPAAACGGYVQVLDLTSCHVSNLVQIR